MNFKFFLLQNSSLRAVGSLLLRAEVESETLWWREETVCRAVQEGGKRVVTEVYSHCSWKGGGWPGEAGANDPE